MDRGRGTYRALKKKTLQAGVAKGLSDSPKGEIGFLKKRVTKDE